MEQETKTMKLGDALPQTYNTEFVFLEYDKECESFIYLDKLDGSMRIHEFGGESEDSQKYERVALGLKQVEGREKGELLIPKSVYNELQKFMVEYKDKLAGIKIKKEGTGLKTKYTGYPLFKD